MKIDSIDSMVQLVFTLNDLRGYLGEGPIRVEVVADGEHSVCLLDGDGFMFETDLCFRVTEMRQLEADVVKILDRVCEKISRVRREAEGAEQTVSLINSKYRGK